MHCFSVCGCDSILKKGLSAMDPVTVQESETYVRELATTKLDTIHIIFCGDELPSAKAPSSSNSPTL